MIAKLVIAVLALVTVCRAQVKVPVQVYYESLCPDSGNFINNQLYPTYKDLEKYIDLKLIPFGKSTYQTLGSDINFNCHHGPNECYGNKVHSCAISQIQIDSYRNDHTRDSLIVEYVNCLMRQGIQFKDQPYPLERCARETEVKNIENIRNCANSTEGASLLRENGDMTLKFQSPLTSVPTIVFKQQYDAEAQKLAVTNFRKAICDRIQGPKPRECSGTLNGSTSMSYSVVTIVAAFILRTMFH